ncbi:MAG: DNA topoisomerase (ATP-hydrolyzing) subunit A [Candidatus Limiplasma sp.]|nr:DNA topoisomerase (ATP-hydrolyzing) subunit A [Candidatus Limiplasma sp.]
MSRKDDKTPVIEENIVSVPMEEVMHMSMIPYAEHVIMDRAIPRVEDGMKPVQRRILFTMNELGITPDTPYRKCARIVGDCLGKYHPHGDSSVYDALVRLAQDFSMRGTLVDGHGNFGSVDGDSAAAMRYTEARMTPLAMLMLKDIDKDTVPFRLNFDDTLKEPDMLPASFPNLLVNGAGGIAVGLATNIPPHNLRESINAVIAQIDNPDITVDELMKIIPAPDFPTGGILLNTPELRAAYETGRGKLLLRAKTHIEDGPAGRKLIVITEIPYQVNKSAMLEKILRLSEEKKAALGCIYDIRDESDRTGMRAVIELRKDADVDKVLAYLFKYSDMQVTFGVNMVAIADGKPRLLSLRRMIRYYIRHRKNVITARTQYELDKAKARAHILEGLMIAVDNLDEVIQLIRKSENPKAAKAGLMERFGLTEIQAQAILDMRLQRLTGLEILALRKEYAELLKTIAELEAILNNEKKLMNVIKKELQAVADQFGDERRTTIEEVHNVVEALVKEEKTAEEALVTFSREGYLRRSWPKAKKAAQPEDGLPDDPPVYSFETDTDHTLFFFTNLGNCYQLNVGALPEMNKPKDRGSLLSGVLAGLETDEKPVYLMCATAEELNTLPDLLFVTARGQLKRSAASEYAVKRSKFGALNLREGDSLHAVLSLDLSADVLMISETGMCIRFHADQVPAMGRVSGGVKGMTLDLNDRILWVGQPAAADQMLLLTERGFGKRVPYTDYEPQARGGKGVKTFYYQKSGSNGTRIAGAALITAPGQNVVIHQKTSKPTQLSADEVILQSKQDRGMPYVMALMDDTVTGVTIV